MVIMGVRGGGVISPHSTNIVKEGLNECRLQTKVVPEPPVSNRIKMLVIGGAYSVINNCIIMELCTLTTSTFICNT